MSNVEDELSAITSTRASKQAEREALEADVQAFLASGGKIMYHEYDPNRWKLDINIKYGNGNRDMKNGKKQN